MTDDEATSARVHPPNGQRPKHHKQREQQTPESVLLVVNQCPTNRYE